MQHYTYGYTVNVQQRDPWVSLDLILRTKGQTLPVVIFQLVLFIDCDFSCTDVMCLSTEVRL